MNRQEKLNQLLCLFRTPESKTKICSFYERYQEEFSGCLHTINSIEYQNAFLRKVYNEVFPVAMIGTKSSAITEIDNLSQSINSIDLNVNVDSENKSGLIKSVNHLNICKKCLSQGRSEEEARNLSSQYILPRGDEIGIEKLTCNSCGSKWTK